MAGAIFLDRDGVINYNRDDYVKTPDEFVFLPGSAEAAARLTRAGRSIFIVSNQAGLGKGLITDADLARITEKMLAGLAAAGATVQGVYYCTHLPDAGCDCRKPRPGMIRRAAREHGLDLLDAVMVGDDPRDVEAGAAVGARTVLVLSGKTRVGELTPVAGTEPCRATHVAADLIAAVDWILDGVG